MTEQRLIDVNAIPESATTISTEGRLYVAWSEIVKAPTVDAVPVVHGRWLFETANHREYMKCSVCLKSQTPTGVFTYCPNCGAKMDLEE